MSVDIVVGEDGCWRVHGELTFATVMAALERSRPLMGTADRDPCIDLAGVERADSAGIALLLEWMRLAAAHGRQVAFSAVPAQMMAIARVSDLEGVLPLHPAG
jgi:phospholipid transport system transporter-binding protein